MSIRAEYFEYLKRFGPTITIRQLHENRALTDVTALRHDVDYDLDLALELSYWEHQHGARATYYLLHTADYWHDPRLIDKCLQIQDFGHEIGLHLNLLTEWFCGGTDDITTQCRKLLARLREGGVDVRGISAHGDPLCYQRGFINYWCFAELKPPDPDARETGMTAEGIRSPDSKWQIEYPPSGKLTRDDGKTFKLWSMRMKELGLDYHAIHVPHDRYFSDTGGDWHRTGDPLELPPGSGRRQILMHPIYWRGDQRLYLFLSTARVGSKWLMNLLDAASPLTARHEFTLNHCFENDNLVAEKQTDDGFVQLEQDKDRARKLMIQARAWIDDLPNDYAEANVYLERFIPQVKEVFADALLVHLCRDPKDVVRSILNRDWYDTPGDARHPIMAVENWPQLSQFEKACWYVRLTNESLLKLCRHRLQVEQMFTDLEELIRRLGALGIAVYPRLAQQEHHKTINANPRSEFPPYSKWGHQLRQVYHRICGPVLEALGYGDAGADDIGGEQREGFRGVGKAGPAVAISLTSPEADGSADLLFEMRFGLFPYHWICRRGCRIRRRFSHATVYPVAGRGGHVMLGGGRWHKLRRGAGWRPRLASYYRAELTIHRPPEGMAHLFCLMYDQAGMLTGKRHLGKLRPQTRPLCFSFRVRSDADRFNVAIHLPKEGAPQWLCLKHFRLEVVSPAAK